MLYFGKVYFCRSDICNFTDYYLQFKSLVIVRIPCQCATDISSRLLTPLKFTLIFHVIFFS